MKFCAFREYDAVATGVMVQDRVFALDDLNDTLGTDFGPDLDSYLRRGQHETLVKKLDASRAPRSGWKPEKLRYAPPIARPPKIWGVGLNFAAHARDLAGDVGEDPMAWMRPATTLVGEGATIRLPPGIGAITAEAEIGVVIGRHARGLQTRREAREAVFGFVPVLDLTAEDLLKKNVRNLTRAKSYDGFCVIGPFITTADEWEPSTTTRIATEVDGKTKEGTVAQMRHDPYELVRFFSHVFPWEPGDLLLTGTPGALPIRSGSALQATIDGLGMVRASAQ